LTGEDDTIAALDILTFSPGGLTYRQYPLIAGSSTHALKMLDWPSDSSDDTNPNTSLVQVDLSPSDRCEAKDTSNQHCVNAQMADIQAIATQPTSEASPTPFVPFSQIQINWTDSTWSTLPHNSTSTSNPNPMVP